MEQEESKKFWKGIISESSALNPVDRISEIIYGLIMCLTFTGAISASGKSEVRDLLWAALGCNVAWGIVDGIIYIMNVLIERGHARKLLVMVRDSKSDEAMLEVLREGLAPLVSTLMRKEEMLRLGKEIKSIPVPSKRSLLMVTDFWPVILIFIIVFVSTLPVAFPFLFMTDVMVALRISNGITLLLLFVAGYRLAQYAGFRPVVAGIVYMLVGAVLVLITIALGG